MSSQYFKLKYLWEGILLESLLEDEPVGWDKVEFIISRDLNYFGLNYKYINGEVQLEFDKVSGLDIIEKVFDKYGSDGYILLEFGYLDGTNYKIEDQGKLNLNTRKKVITNKKDIHVTCTVETTGFHELLNSRKDINVNLIDKNTLDGKTKESLNFDTLILKSSNIDRYTEIVDVKYNSSETIDVDMHWSWWITTFTFNPNNQTALDIKDFIGSNFGLFKKSELGDNSYQTANAPQPIFPESMIQIKEDGLYKFKIELNLNCELHAKGSGNFFWDIKYYVFFRLNNTSNISLYYDAPYYNRDPKVPKTSWTNDLTININKEIQLTNGDTLTLYFAAFTYTYYKPNSFQITEKRRSIEISTTSTAGDSECNAIYLIDAIKNVIEATTGETDCVKSNYLERESGKYNYAITNGYLLRNQFINGWAPQTIPVSIDPFFKVIYADLYPINLSLTSLLNSLKSIFGLGMSYEFDSNGKQSVVIEPFEYYFQDKEILMIENISDYSEEVAKEFIYNEIAIGYSKYPEETNEALDEYNTKLEFSTPIQTNKNKLLLVSDFVASNYAIEETRRAQFDLSQDSTKATKYDENIFILAVDNDGNSESIENITTENIKNVGNLFNLRITPKRNLLRWAKWINSFLFKKIGTDLIRNTLSVKNGNATTTALNTDDATLYSASVTEKSNIPINSLQNRAGIHSATWVNFVARLSQDEISIIKNALSGVDQSKLNGWLAYRNVNGYIDKGWIYDMRYSPISEKVIFKLLKKDLSLSESQGNCSDYARYTFADFESSELPSWIEECTFNNFN